MYMHKHQEERGKTRNKEIMNMNVHAQASRRERGRERKRGREGGREREGEREREAERKQNIGDG
jgi:hypothetical protein